MPQICPPGDEEAVAAVVVVVTVTVTVRPHTWHEYRWVVDRAQPKGTLLSVKQALLALLEEGPMYGYQLRSELEQRTGATWPLNVGQVYTTLSRLERDGFGSGKSTLLTLSGGLDQPSACQVHVEGADLAEVGLDEVGIGDSPTRSPDEMSGRQAAAGRDRAGRRRRAQADPGRRAHRSPRHRDGEDVLRLLRALRVRPGCW